MFSQLTHLQFSCLLMSLQNIWSYVWHPFIATANLKCQGCTWQEHIAAYSYVTPFHHQPLLCSYVWANVQIDRQTDTHTHTKPANPLQCQISRCNAHWQYQASANNLREGILKYLGLSKAHYSHKWWRNNANLCQVSDSSDKTLLTPWSRVSQSTNSLHFMKPKGSLPHSQVTTTRPYPEPYHLITKWKNVI